MSKEATSNLTDLKKDAPIVPSEERLAGRLPVPLRAGFSPLSKDRCGACASGKAGLRLLPTLPCPSAGLTECWLGGRALRFEAGDFDVPCPLARFGNIEAVLHAHQRIHGHAERLFDA